ncbi:MAG TPA: 50S ribosomal protein L11 methyltransferase, partial [Pyrinomonadaceae bacterium]|nr:50S ribosomal protein L11 methyltransferase [Pyrinomonadaceae bacterium]
MKKSAKKTVKRTDSPAAAHRKPTKKERDDHFAAHIPGVLNYHALMLADGLRNKLLYKAIKQNVNSETSFLDIGAGTGVWAILAAKLGAKRVVAVEIEECLIPIIYKHAQENGVADRVETVHGNSNDVKLKGRFNVIVSELFGGDALGEGTVKSFVDIRNRFLAPDGVLIPQKLTLMAAPAFMARLSDDLPKSLPLSANFVRSLRLNYSQHLSIADRGDVKLLAEAKPLIDLDFRNISDAPKLENLTVSWTLNNIRKANAIVTFTHSTFTDSIEMDSFGSQSWGASLSEFTPFDAKKGELFFRTTLDPEHGNWTVAVPGEPALKPQNFSQVFAFTRLRMAQ